MNYYLQRFGPVYAEATPLPVLGADQRIGPDRVLPTNIILPGHGTFNTKSTDQALPSGHTVTAGGSYQAADEAALQVLIDAMQAWIGKRSILWLLCADTSVRWRYARLLTAPLRHLARGHGRFKQPMDLTFELDDMLWYGDDATRTLTMAQSSLNFEVNNAGNQVVRDIVITVTAKGSAIIQFDLVNSEADHYSSIKFSGTIAQDTDLVIDLGEMSVKNHGADAWDDLDRTETHRINELLRIAPGDNTLSLHRIGGDGTSTCKLEFYDGYQ